MRTTLQHERDREGTTDELGRLRKELDKGFFDDEKAAQQHPSSSKAAAMSQQQQQTAETT
jgi:hypothetical protein